MFEQHDPPVTERQLTGNDHAGEVSADHDGRRGVIVDTRACA
jgi:hypothetical protein